jgi:hypothetical protein
MYNHTSKERGDRKAKILSGGLTGLAYKILIPKNKEPGKEDIELDRLNVYLMS